MSRFCVPKNPDERAHPIITSTQHYRINSMKSTITISYTLPILQLYFSQIVLYNKGSVSYRPS